MKPEISFNLAFEITSEKVANDFDLQSLKIVKVNWISSFYTIFCEFKNESHLNKYWENFISIIALEMSNYLIEDFEKWNVYLFFINPEKVSNTLQYKIENDTFFCRKIIPHPFKSIQKNEDVIDLLNKYVLYSDIELEAKIKSNALISVVGDKDNYSESVIFNAINKPSKTNDNEIIYNEIYSILKKQQVDKDE